MGDVVPESGAAELGIEVLGSSNSQLIPRVDKFDKSSRISNV